MGLFELSLAHVSIAATPWEAPLYRFRAHLVFPPIFSSIFALAQAVDNFERQAEQLIMKKLPKSSIMTTICNSPNEAALALQSLPLLSLTGYSSPRDSITLGHSPVAIPVLLSEVFMHMCPPNPSNIIIVKHPSEYSSGNGFPKVSHSHVKTSTAEVTQEVLQEASVDGSLYNKIKVGVVGGSFDSYPGRIVAGLVDSMMTAPERSKFHFITMCFPTPRDTTE